MQCVFTTRKNVLALAIATGLAIGLAACGGGGSEGGKPSLPAVSTSQVRSVALLDQQSWKFLIDTTKLLDNTTAETALASTGQSVQLPHTWNANDAATTSGTTPYYRGVGWYSLDFNYSGGAGRQWLQFDGASIVADVWLNGVKLGVHSGAFTAFRFDVSSLLNPGKNTLIVKVDNTSPATGTDRTAIAPLSGDFNMSGGLYRSVSLVSTPSTAHIALNDLGSTGVFAKTTSLSSISNSGGSAFGSATVDVLTKLSNTSAIEANYSVRTSLIDKAGAIAASTTTEVWIAAGKDTSLSQLLSLGQARLWNGIKDPYLYSLVVELADSAGNIIDKSVQQFGIRQMKFDANTGFYLNENAYPLHGVNIHQDVLGKAWAVSNADIDEKLAAVVEIGANAVRFAHYPYSDYSYAKADQLGLVVWAETAFVNQALTGSQGRTGVVNGDCTSTSTVPQTFVDNLLQQTQEMIRQNFNHSSIGMWSIANEVNTIALCQGVDTVTPILKALNDLSHAEDSSRVSVLADMVQGRESSFPAYSRVGTGGITDVVGYNRYFGWYYSVVESINDFSAHLDALHALFPTQPLSISEYGAGAAVSHQTDNPLGGQINNFDLSGGTVVNYQPEGYASFVHEQNYATMLSKPYIWGTFIWNMFDFGSGVRNEGDVRGVNTKGIVTFDHVTKKDPYYFYQANWRKDIPVLHITGKRYANRAYKVADIKVYSNTDTTSLTVNGVTVNTMTAAQCTLTVSEIASSQAVPNTCLFKAVPLATGTNTIVVSGSRNGIAVSDTASWVVGNDNAVNTYIAAGQATTGFTQASSNAMFGSDNFFTGGKGNNLTPLGNTDSNQDRTVASGFSNSGDAPIWKSYRHGTSFQYNIPMANGTYTVTLGFLEPTKTTTVGGRVFDVTANGATVISGLDVLAAAGTYRTAITRSFSVTVSNGVLNLGFTGTIGEAVVSNITVHR